MLSSVRKPKGFLPGLHHRSQPCHSRGFSTTSPKRNYDPTLPNLRIGRHTRVIFQGFTGENTGYIFSKSLTNNVNRSTGIITAHVLECTSD